MIYHLSVASSLRSSEDTYMTCSLVAVASKDIVIDIWRKTGTELIHRRVQGISDCQSTWNRRTVVGARVVKAASIYMLYMVEITVFP